jgi:predicted RNA binding protein YcfA (HicA-like mRNA interferase family)
MSRLRQLSARDVLRALGSFGFQVVRIRGSHAKLRRVLANGDRQTLTVPLHKTLAPGTLHAIFRQSLRFIPESDLRPWFFTESR